MDKATGWPYDIGGTVASRSSHQSQVLGGNAGLSTYFILKTDECDNKRSRITISNRKC